MENIFIESINQNIELEFSDTSFGESISLECAPPIIRMPELPKPVTPNCPGNFCCVQCT